MAYNKKPLLVRFWEKVDKSAGYDGCWMWTAAKCKGYGAFGFDGRKQYAHRVSWQLTHGPIPGGEGVHGTCVCHRCDTPLCVNPAHLFLGSVAENTADMIQKGRNAKGARHPNAKITERDVVRILTSNELQKDMAIDLGISKTVVSAIKRREHWKHVELS